MSTPMTKEEAREALDLIRDVVGKVHDDTVLQQWGIVMVISAVLNVIALSLTQLFVSQGRFVLWPYILVWGSHLSIKLVASLWVRSKAGGTLTYVEKHVWGNGITYVIACSCTVGLDLLLLPLADAIRVIPAHMAVVSAVSFAIISLINPRFYINTLLFFVTAGVIGFWPSYGFAILGIVWFFGLLGPGILFMREHRRAKVRMAHTEVT